MINAIITDFDGTLVNTFRANLMAYQEAFRQVGMNLTEEEYQKCFGLRFDDFMNVIGVSDSEKANAIKEAKKETYPLYFSELKVNKILLDFIVQVHATGAKTAIASTARKENLYNAVAYLGIADHFDIVYAGNDVKHGKPSPEIYEKAMKALGVSPSETLIFEDSHVGFEAATACGAQYMPITSLWFK